MNDLARARTWGWVIIFVMSAFLMFFLYYAPTAAVFEHTYQVGPVVGQLHSRRWSFDFVVVAMLQFLWVVPFTLAFLLDDPSLKWRYMLHNVLSIIVGLWTLVTFFIGCSDWAKANAVDPGNFYNRANDDRWCCVNYPLTGAPCTNTVGCTPGVSAADLHTNGVFLFQLWCSFVAVLATVGVLLFSNMALPRAVAQGDGDAEEVLLGAEVGRSRRTYRPRKQ